MRSSISYVLGGILDSRWTGHGLVQSGPWPFLETVEKTGLHGPVFCRTGLDRTKRPYSPTPITFLFRYRIFKNLQLR